MTNKNDKRQQQSDLAGLMDLFGAFQRCIEANRGTIPAGDAYAAAFAFFLGVLEAVDGSGADALRRGQQCLDEKKQPSPDAVH